MNNDVYINTVETFRNTIINYMFYCFGPPYEIPYVSFDYINFYIVESNYDGKLYLELTYTDSIDNSIHYINYIPINDLLIQNLINYKIIYKYTILNLSNRKMKSFYINDDLFYKTKYDTYIDLEVLTNI